MPRLRGIAYLTFLAFFFVSVGASTNFTQCLTNFRDGNVTEGGTDYDGRPVSNPKDAVALTYKACTELCGDRRESSDWSAFSQQFSAWLLPWLALASQLPFGAESRLDNLISGKFPLTRIGPHPPLFSPSCTSHPDRWVSRPRSVFACPYGHQHSLGK